MRPAAVSLKSICLLSGERFSLFRIPVTHREAINRHGQGEMSGLLNQQPNGRILVNPADVLLRHLLIAREAAERDLYSHERRLEPEL